ncbi:alpha/beta hydrolase-fold protein [uncultured Bacteroides sp.]|uniref:alpha/beta hydrolase-fold protein n=1 Tax=uncultured Bacteroides sp. TaxID=162156 RepID=UPI0026192C7D|nr:alpha/beta hydrolase-fold protein [uncultured Bacteroides sp.]
MKKFFLMFAMLLGFNGNIAAQTSDASTWKTDEVFSKAMSQKRMYCIYLPAGFDKGKEYPVIYAADGKMLVDEKYNLVLDSLIGERRIPPVILIGAFANDRLVTRTDMPFLHYEYVERYTKDIRLKARYDNHKIFFTEELRAKILPLYGVQPLMDKQIGFGCSEAGDYMLRLNNECPERFTHFICFSPLSCNVKGKITGKKGPQIYFAYGTDELESIIGMNLKELDEKIHEEKLKNPAIHLSIYLGGHEKGIWKKEFAETLVRLFNED